MNKLLSIVMCVLVLCMMLCACGANESVSEMASDSVDEIETVASEMFTADDGTVNDGDGVIGNEDPSNTTDTQDNTGTFDDETVNSRNATEPYM